MEDPKSVVPLLIILAVVFAIVVIADAVIFFRWLAYLWERQAAEERIYREAAQRAETALIVPLPDAAVALEQNASLPEYPFSRTWSLVDPFLAFQVVFVGGQVIISAALIPLILVRGQDGIYSSAGIIIQCLGLILLNGLFVGATMFYLHRYRTTLVEIGLKRPSLRQLGVGFGLGLALFGVAFAVEWATGALLPHLLPKQVYQGLVNFTKAVTAGGMFTKIDSLPLKIAFALTGAIAAPIGEEVFFRGFLYNALKRKLNVPAAIVISALMFALIHIGPLAILAIFPMGMLLACVYEKTRSLWVTICMHATNNGLAFVLTLLYPGLGDTPTEPVKPPAPRTKPAAYRPVSQEPRQAFIRSQAGRRIDG